MVGEEKGARGLNRSIEMVAMDPLRLHDRGRAPACGWPHRQAPAPLQPAADGPSTLLVDAALMKNGGRILALESAAAIGVDDADRGAARAGDEIAPRKHEETAFTGLCTGVGKLMDLAKGAPTTLRWRRWSASAAAAYGGLADARLFRERPVNTAILGGQRGKRPSLPRCAAGDDPQRPRGRGARPHFRTRWRGGAARAAPRVARPPCGGTGKKGSLRDSPDHRINRARGLVDRMPTILQAG